MGYQQNTPGASRLHHTAHSIIAKNQHYLIRKKKTEMGSGN
jgi:hypothetical protein